MTPFLDPIRSYMGRPIELTDNFNGITWAKEVTYGPANEMTQMKYRYGMWGNTEEWYRETRTYNTNLQLTQLAAQVTPDNFTAAQVNLEYRYSSSQNNGQIYQSKDWISGQEANYTYDALGQLTAASTTGPDWGLSFTYDGFGNRTTQSVTKGSGPTVSLSINPANNRINSSGYTYDANGNLTAMPSWTFVYDIENRLVKATNAGSEYYGYDPWNRRVWKTTGTSGSGDVFFYGAFGEVMGKYHYNAGSLGIDEVEKNLHFAGKLIRWNNAAVVLDRLGGVKLRSDIAATPPITQNSNYYPFGEERSATPQDRAKFATYYRDNKTGFDYAMNRYYNNSWGRFLTPDPFAGSANPANPLSWNRYAYVANDPINRIDPSGLDPNGLWDDPWYTNQCKFETINDENGYVTGYYWACSQGRPGIYTGGTIHRPSRPAPPDAAGKLEWAKRLILNRLDYSRDCKNDLLILGTSIAGVYSHIKYDMRMLNAATDPDIPGRNRYAIEHDGAKFSAESPGNRVWYDSSLVNKDTNPSNLAAGYFHESVHNLTGLTDFQIEGILQKAGKDIKQEWGGGQSDKITNILRKDCFEK